MVYLFQQAIKELKEKRSQDKAPKSENSENKENTETMEEQANSGPESGYLNSSTFTGFSSTDTVIPGLDLVNEDGNVIRETIADSSETVVNGDMNHKPSDGTNGEGVGMEVDSGVKEQNGVNSNNVDNSGGSNGEISGTGVDSVDSGKDKVEKSEVTDDLDPRNFSPKLDLDTEGKKEGESDSVETADASAESEGDIDDRLASFAKASEMLHSIAKMAQADSELNTEDDYKSESDLETEVTQPE